MEVIFFCIQGGKRLYRVRLNGQEIFVGAHDECERFMEIHNRKVAQQLQDEQRVPRARPFPVRTYRQLRAQA